MDEERKHTPLKLVLLGYGRMGQRVEKLLPHYPGIMLHSIKKRDDSLKVLKDAHIAIDFSTAGGVDAHIDAAITYKVPLLICVTGLASTTHKKMTEAAFHIPICYAPNTSIGIAILNHFVEKTANLLREYDIEICEIHHKHKVDAPSGTSLLLGEAAAKGRSVNLSEYKVYPHTHKRQEGQIGFAVMRGGSAPGEHHVNFFGDEDMITLTHKSYTPDLFAKGALDLGVKLAKKENGFYTVSDLLNLF